MAAAASAMVSVAVGGRIGGRIGGEIGGELVGANGAGALAEAGEFDEAQQLAAVARAAGGVLGEAGLQHAAQGRAEAGELLAAVHGLDRGGTAGAGGELGDGHGPGVEVGGGGEVAAGGDLGGEVREGEGPDAAQQDGAVAQRGEAVLIDGRAARADEHAGAGEHAVDDAVGVQGGEGAGELAREATDLGGELEGTCPVVQVVEGDAAGERLVDDAAAVLVGAGVELRDEGGVAEVGEAREARGEGGAAGLVGEQLGVEDAGAGELAGLAVEHGPGGSEDLHADARRLLTEELDATEDRGAGVKLQAASGVHRPVLPKPPTPRG
jgi:hypothetical protein